MTPAMRTTLALLCAIGCAACGGGGGGGGFRFTSTPGGAVAIRTSWSYQAATAGGRGTVTYTLAQAPSGASVSANGLVVWTPAYADLGNASFVLRASDDGGALDQPFTLRVHQGIEMGVALSPRGHTSSSTNQDWIDHLQGSSPHGRARGFHGSWRDAVSDDGQVPQLFTAGGSFVATYGCVGSYVVGWSDGAGAPDLTSESEPGNNTWSNSETRAEFLTMVTALAQSQRPPLLLLGNEVNAWFVTHSQVEWDLWIGEYEACYDAIKAASPGTQVGMVFQLELLKGLGGNTGWAFPPQWAIVDGLIAGGRLDVLGFTSYPYLHHDQLAQVPADHFEEIALHWGGPVAFTEIGWLAAPHAPYPGGEQEQADFVTQFFALTDDLPLTEVVWLFLHDWDGQAGQPAFADVGLRNNDGTVVRAADAVWRDAVALRQR